MDKEHLAKCRFHKAMKTGFSALASCFGKAMDADNQRDVCSILDQMGEAHAVMHDHYAEGDEAEKAEVDSLEKLFGGSPAASVHVKPPTAHTFDPKEMFGE